MVSSLAPFLTKNDHKKRKYHLKVVSCTQMISTFTRANPREHLWDVVGHSHQGCAADRFVATVWCYHLNMQQILWGMFSGPCWIYAVVWKEKRVQPSTSNLYLIKWPITVSYCMFFHIYFLTQCCSWASFLLCLSHCFHPLLAVPSEVICIG